MIAALIGIAVSVGVSIVIIVADPKITKTEPSLVLLIAVMLSGVLGGWRDSPPVAAVAGVVYGFAYVAPVGVIRIGLTEGTLSLITFLVVALIVSALADLGQTRQTSRERQTTIWETAGLARLRLLVARPGQRVDPRLQFIDQVYKTRRRRTMGADRPR